MSASEAAGEPTIPLRLLGERALSPSVLALRLSAQSPAFVWKPGQHVSIAAPGGFLKAYSMASRVDPALPGEFDLAISESGNQELLAARGVGLSASVPAGTFTWRSEALPTLLVGMGTGIAPLRAMLQAALADAGDFPIALLFGARGEEDVLWSDELRTLAERDRRFRFEPTLSRPRDEWRGRRGRVQAHLDELARALPGARAYVCGSAAMASECEKLLAGVLGADGVRSSSY